TAVAGQVLTMHGRGLAHVTLAMGNQTAQTDETGRFLLTHLAPGTQVLSIDGQSATRDGAHYGFYQVRVDVKDHQTNVLDYTIWDTKLDPAGSITLPSPTTQG